MAKYGVEVTEERDTTEAEPKDLDYSSEYQSLKLHKVHKGTFTTNASGVASTSIPHDLNYVPVAVAYYKSPTGNWLGVDNYRVAVQTSRIDVQINTAQDTSGGFVPLTPSTTYTYKFWVFADPAQEL